MSEEKTQIFRGDEAPEMGIAETGGPAQAPRRPAPSDQRALQDQRDGEQHLPETHDARGGEDVRELPATATDGPVDGHDSRDAAGPVEMRESRDAGGASDLREMSDAQGAADVREMHDGDGASEQRRMDDADGLSELRQLHDHTAAQPAPAAAKEKSALNFNEDEVVAPAPEAPAVASPRLPPRQVDPPSAADDADLTFKVERDATPWALSIHLEERIASLGVTTAKVNQQLDALEESTRRLAKRIGK